ncbi:MAG: hypothetical protein NVS1B6_01480 [Steroidobacteraceae bacterium]
MKRALFLSAALLWAGTARAELPVIDIGGHVISFQQLAQALKQVAADETKIANQVTQIMHLKATVESVMHGDILALAELGPELSGMGIGDLVPNVGGGGAEMMEAVSGVAFATGRLATLSNRVLSNDALYLPSASDWSAGRMVSQARSFAAQKAMAQASFDSSAKQIKELQAVRAKAASAGDVTAAAQATAAISAINAKAQMEGNQLASTQIMQAALAGTAAAQEQQLSRCAYERLAANSVATQQAAQSGQVQFVTNTSVSCSATASAALVADNSPGTMTRASYSAPISGGGNTLDTMLAQPWGQAAEQNAVALGVSPTALAATCVMESGCSTNVGGTGTISGAFQMSNGTFAEAWKAAATSNPDLTSQASGAKNDPASQSIAAAQYLKQGAQTLQGAGIANPTSLDVRGYYQFGPANAASVAAAPDNQLMAGTLTGLSARTLAANNINADTTVGQWRQTVTSKLGAAAAQPVLLQGAIRT